MREIIAEDQPFVRDEMPADDARRCSPTSPTRSRSSTGPDDDGHEPMPATAAGRHQASTENTPRFIDLCRGPHVPHRGGSGTSS